MRRFIAAGALLWLAGCNTVPGTGGSMPNRNGPLPPAYPVFFDNHDVTLTSFAQKIVNDAANDAKQHPLMYVRLTGPSTKTAEGYDPTIAETRMRLVEQALVADGVPPERQFRAEPTPDMLKNDPTGRQRVVIHLVNAKPPAS
jgi:hypothetical protein